jgi:hypothetical protein
MRQQGRYCVASLTIPVTYSNLRNVLRKQDVNKTLAPLGPPKTNTAGREHLYFTRVGMRQMVAGVCIAKVSFVAAGST